MNEIYKIQIISEIKDETSTNFKEINGLVA